MLCGGHGQGNYVRPRHAYGGHRQLLTISLGVEGGFRAIADKYGEESTPGMRYTPKGLTRRSPTRIPPLANTVDSVCKFRDYAFAELLKLHKLL